MLNNIIILISLITFWSGVIYRVYALNTVGVIISLFLVLASFLILHYFRQKNNKLNNYSREIHKARKKQPRAINYLILPVYLLLISACFILLFKSRSANAIISPWQIVPAGFFVFYGLSTALLFIILTRVKKYSIAFLSLHYFLSLGVALIVYRLGYGFDPFIHRATLDLIDKIGSVDPKPFYYLGQYGLIIILHKITFIPLAWLDKLLVPVLAAVLIPAALFQTLKKWFSEKASHELIALLLLIIPFSVFIVTAPQNLAYLFLLLALIFGLKCNNIYNLFIVYLLALAALITHPIAGVPALLFALTLTVYHSNIHRFKRYLYYLIFILTSISLPLAFAFIESKTSLPRATTLRNIFSWPKFIVPGQENFILNFIYLYGFNIKIILTALAAIGVIIAYRNKKNCGAASIYLLMAGGLLTSYYLSTKLNFGYLISYERADFSNRILALSAFFLIPFFLLAIHAFVYKLTAQNKAIKIPFLIFLVLLITASLYLSYPRFDHYFNSHSYAVSQNDISATRWIENDASSSDYIVLANQQVSAAALSEFGFKKYYKKNIFYYPIPTGAPLYGYYLDMVYKKPDRDTMRKAMDLAGADTGYFVLNKYWWAFPKILAEAKLSADSWQVFGENEIYVFKYKK